MKKVYRPKAVVKHITWLQEQIANLEDRCVIIPMREIEGMFPEGGWDVLIDGQPEFVLPMCFDLIPLVRNVFEFAYPDFKRVFDKQFIWESSSSAGHFFHYRPNGEYSKQFSVSFRSEVVGATCVVNIIDPGKEPILEVICSEGAKEGTFRAKANQISDNVS